MKKAFPLLLSALFDLCNYMNEFNGIALSTSIGTIIFTSVKLVFQMKETCSYQGIAMTSSMIDASTAWAVSTIIFETPQYFSYNLFLFF